jgi:hypothetical protein
MLVVVINPYRWNIYICSNMFPLFKKFVNHIHTFGIESLPLQNVQKYHLGSKPVFL